jgi:hypothetical protein
MNGDHADNLRGYNGTSISAPRRSHPKPRHAVRDSMAGFRLGLNHNDGDAMTDWIVFAATGFMIGAVGYLYVVM